MQPTSITLESSDLVKFYATFGTLRPGWKQVVGVTYTVGKDPGSPWGGETPGVAGTTPKAIADESARQLVGTVLIDVRAATMDEAVSVVIRGNKLVTSNSVSLSEMRERVITILSHELLHVLQGWVRPGGYQDADRTAMAKAWGRDLFITRPKEFADRRYYGNVYEQAAFARSKEFAKANRDAIRGGAFDSYLPIPMLQYVQSHI
jgi:hypothetical protein